MLFGELGNLHELNVTPPLPWLPKNISLPMIMKFVRRDIGRNRAIQIARFSKGSPKHLASRHRILDALNRMRPGGTVTACWGVQPKAGQ